METPSPAQGHRVTSVVCIDDNQLVAEALERRLGLERDFSWRGWLSERDDILKRVTDLAPDLVLLDIDLPGLDAFELVQRLARYAPRSRVVMFSGHLRSDYLELALAAGAWGYISKSSSTHALLEALRRVARGDVVLDREASDEMAALRRQEGAGGDSPGNTLE